MKQDGDSVGSREATIFHKVVFNKVTFEQRSKWSEEASHVAIWGQEGSLGSKVLRCQRLVSFKEEQGYMDGVEWAQEIMVGGDEVTELGGSQLIGKKLLWERDLPGNEGEGRVLEMTVSQVNCFSEPALHVNQAKQTTRVLIKKIKTQREIYLENT